VKEDDYKRLNRAIGITNALKKKSYPLSRKIVDEYAKLIAQGQAEPNWDDLARAIGMPEIAELTKIDAAQKAYDVATIMTPEEIEAEKERKEQELLARAKSFAKTAA
jgi:hypothetical protein